MLRKKPHSGNKKRQWDLPDNRLSQALRLFLDWSAVHGFAAGTLRQRERALRRFILWCVERAITAPQELTLPMIERYQRHLFQYRKGDGKPLSWHFQKQELLPIRAWCKWLVRERHLLYNPASELLMPKGAMRLPRYILTVEEVERVINQADITTASGLRDRAMMEVLYSSGLRRSELSRLKEHEVDIKRGSVMVCEGKGKRDRLVPLGARACAWVERYVSEAREALLASTDQGNLFLTDWGSTFHPDTLGDTIKRYLIRAGINAPGACHLFRHACATHMLERGADIRFIQALLGHADLNSTQIYTQVSIAKLKAIHDATHPARLERVGKAQQKTGDTNPHRDSTHPPATLLAALDAAPEQDPL